MIVFPLSLLKVMIYIESFLNSELLYSSNKPYFAMMYCPFNTKSVLFASIWLRIVASVFISETSLKRSGLGLLVWFWYQDYFIKL